MTRKNLSHTGSNILSASRRTDIPAFYIDWFMERIKRGFFNVTNPYNKVTKKIDAGPDRIHTIVFWSKNYRPFLDAGAYNELSEMGYHLFFHFSINSESSMLEPNVPPLKERLMQLEELCVLGSPLNITWRFDPVCYFKTVAGKVENNLEGFPVIAEKASQLGVKRCTTSFADHYRKIDRRIMTLREKGVDAPSFIDIDQDKKIKIVKRMAGLLEKNGIELSLCCERDLFNSAGKEIKVKQSACISGELLSELFKGVPDKKRDYGQRAKQGCNCTKSVDIGSYENHPCFHNCLFCYASPAVDREI